MIGSNNIRAALKNTGFPKARKHETNTVHWSASKDILLRMIRRSAEKNSGGEKAKVRILGVDDFAFRKGQTYGTIPVDLEQRKPIDLLPDREAETLKTWLQAHPEIEVVFVLN